MKACDEASIASHSDNLYSEEKEAQFIPSGHTRYSWQGRISSDNDLLAPVGHTAYSWTSSLTSSPCGDGDTILQALRHEDGQSTINKLTDRNDGASDSSFIER